MEEKIKLILNDLKINRTKSGYYLWINLISKVFKNYSLKEVARLKITNLYSELAIENNLTYTAVEKSLKRSIEEKENEIQEYFDFDEDITNKRFLVLMIEELHEMK